MNGQPTGSEEQEQDQQPKQVPKAPQPEVPLEVPTVQSSGTSTPPKRENKFAKRKGKKGDGSPPDLTQGSNISGEIEGSDFTQDGQLKRRKKKKKVNPLGGVFVLLLLVVIVIGAIKFTTSPNKEPLDNVSNIEAENDPAKDYVPPITIDPEDIIVEEEPEDESDEPVVVDGDEPVTPELTDEERFKNYVQHDNKYTNFSVKYPSDWFINERVQESFNEIKLLTKDVKNEEFTFNTIQLANPISLVDFKSPDKANTAYITLSAYPTEGFDKEALYIDFELPEALIDVQPKQNVLETINGRTVEIAYTLKKEFDLMYLTIQAFERVGGNTIVYTFKEPFFDARAVVGAETDPAKPEGEEVEEDKDVKNEAAPPENLTIEEIKESAKSDHVFHNLLYSMQFK